MELHAYAKINWTLDIVGQRADGYHLMDMLMQPVSCFDTVWLSPSDQLKLICEGNPLLPADEHHLALRAARALQRETGCNSGAVIRVFKRIPVGAGMGGGSADAAAVLIGLNQLWSLSLPKQELMRIGLTLGADVPFCLQGGLARVGGIGEDMEDTGFSPQAWLCVVQPCGALSTKEVFQGYHAAEGTRHPDTRQALIALQTGDWQRFSAAAGNVLQAVSLTARPPIGEAIRDLMTEGALFAQMTGSGSAVYGVFGNEKAAAQAAQRLLKRYTTCFAAHTIAAGVEVIQT